jgi:hypothetical protein
VFRLGGKMGGPDALYLAGAAGSERGCFADGVTSGAESDDSLVGRGFRSASGVFSGRLGKLHSLTLPFAPGFVVVASHLQGKF